MIVKIKCNWSCDRPVIEIFKEGTYLSVAEGFTPNFLAFHIVANGGPASEMRGFVPETHNDLWDATCELL